MKYIKKLVPTIFLFGYTLVSAGPSQPTNPGGGSTGGSGTGAPAAPVDMYVYILGIIAIMLIIFFSKKYTPKKI